MNHVMIDLETMGLRPGSMILSIGAIRFDPRADGIPAGCPTFHRGIDISTATGSIDPATLKWWFSQSPTVVANMGGVLNSPDVLDERLALNLLACFITEVADTKVWSNGANMDIAILSEHYDAAGFKRPWHYRNVRCYRTLMSEFGNDDDMAPYHARKGHDALDDAAAQALSLQRLYWRKGW